MSNKRKITTNDGILVGGTIPIAVWTVVALSCMLSLGFLFLLIREQIQDDWMTLPKSPSGQGGITSPIQPLASELHVIAPGPLRVDPVNSRYFMDGSGNTILLTGAHTWSNFQDNGGSNPPPVFNYPAYLDFLQANNHNFIRLWIWEQARWAAETADDNYWFHPMAPFLRTGPGNALDGKPKFDLSQLDQTYFDRIRQRAVLAGQRGIYVSLQLFNGWSVDPKSPWGGGKNIPWRGHPFNLNNNINGINGDPNGDNSGIESEDLSIPAITAIQDAYVKKVVDAVNDLDNVLYEICNECADGSWQSSDSTAWQYHMVDLIHSYEAGKPKQHPVGISQISADDTNLFVSNADWISIHDSGSLDSPYISDGTKVVFTDTDHVCGVCGNRTWAWKTFMNGKNPTFMDGYDGAGYGVGGEGFDSNNPQWVSIRSNLGYILNFSRRVNLKTVIPHPDLCSTRYCLANPVVSAAEYLVYLPTGGSASVDLSATFGPLNIEWFNPANGTVAGTDTTMGGATRAFTAPFSGDAVLYIYATVPATQTPTPTRTNTSLPPTLTKTNTPLGPTGTRTNTPTIPAATRTNTPLPPTVTRTNTSIGSSVTRTNTPSGPTAPWTPTTTSTLNFSTLPPTSPLTFPTLTFTPPGESTVTPSMMGTVPVTTAASTLTSTPVPPESGSSRTLLYWVIGILLTAAIIGVLFYLLWVFRQLN